MAFFPTKTLIWKSNVLKKYTSKKKCEKREKKMKHVSAVSSFWSFWAQNGLWTMESTHDSWDSREESLCNVKIATCMHLMWSSMDNWPCHMPMCREWWWSWLMWVMWHRWWSMDYEAMGLGPWVANGHTTTTKQHQWPQTTTQKNLPTAIFQQYKLYLHWRTIRNDADHFLRGRFAPVWYAYLQRLMTMFDGGRLIRVAKRPLEE